MAIRSSKMRKFFTEDLTDPATAVSGLTEIQMSGC